MRVLVWAGTVRNIQISLEKPHPSPSHVELHRGEMPDQEKEDLEIKSCSEAWEKMDKAVLS